MFETTQAELFRSVSLAIALPGQDVLNRALATTSTEPTTSQGLVLDEVILRFRHPNAGVRKESLGGLKEIVAVAPERQVGKVVRAVGGMVSDEVGSAPMRHRYTADEGRMEQCVKPYLAF